MYELHPPRYILFLQFDILDIAYYNQSPPQNWIDHV